MKPNAGWFNVLYWNILKLSCQSRQYSRIFMVGWRKPGILTNISTPFQIVIWNNKNKFKKSRIFFETRLKIHDKIVTKPMKIWENGQDVPTLRAILPHPANLYLFLFNKNYFWKWLHLKLTYNFVIIYIWRQINSHQVFESDRIL